MYSRAQNNLDSDTFSTILISVQRYGVLYAEAETFGFNLTGLKKKKKKK